MRPRRAMAGRGGGFLARHIAAAYARPMGLAWRRFVRDEVELAVEARRAKEKVCPHCLCLGAVNAHGVLRGYSETGEHGTLRGRRFFCSNRGRRPGCGRTFSVLLRAVVATFVVRTGCLSRFVHARLRGEPFALAWAEAARGALSLRTGLRLWRALRLGQGRLRQALCRFGPPPAEASRRPLAQSWAHLSQSFPDARTDLFAAFQEKAQLGLFE